MKALEESVSDWIIIDLRSLLKGNYILTIDGKQYCYSFQFDISDSVLRNNIIKYWENNKVAIDDLSIQKVNFVDLPGYDRIFDEFCLFLKNRYGKKIILLLLRQTDYVVNGIGEPTYVGSKERGANNLLLDMYACKFMEKVDCHCIHVPANIVGDDHNPWGPGDVHYVREYFDYGLECLDIITGSHRDKLHRLNRAYAKYILIFDQIIYGLSYTEFSTVYTFEKRIRECKNKEDLNAVKSDYRQLFDTKCNIGIISEIEGRFGRAYRDGKGVEKDLRMAAEWMRKAAAKKASWTNELFDVLWAIDAPESKIEMVTAITRLAETEDESAMGRLGRAYRDGKGVEKDLRMAAEWMRKAAAKKAAWTNELFDVLWAIGTPESHGEMIVAVGKFADKGDAGALGRLGRAYRDGRGVERDLAKAAEWMRRATSKNIAWTNELFDVLWAIGTPESHGEMVSTIKKLANTEDADAMGRLGRAYRDGRGVERDLAKAAEWMRKAAKKKATWEKELSELPTQSK